MWRALRCGPAFIDSNQNDLVSVLELNKMSKDSGMVKGITDFFKKQDGEKIYSSYS